MRTIRCLLHSRFAVFCCPFDSSKKNYNDAVLSQQDGFRDRIPTGRYALSHSKLPSRWLGFERGLRGECRCTFEVQLQALRLVQYSIALARMLLGICPHVVTGSA